MSKQKSVSTSKGQGSFDRYFSLDLDELDTWTFAFKLEMRGNCKQSCIKMPADVV